MQKQKRNEGIALLILNSALDGGVDVQSHAPIALTAGKNPDTHFT